MTQPNPQPVPAGYPQPQPSPSPSPAPATSPQPAQPVQQTQVVNPSPAPAPAPIPPQTQPGGANPYERIGLIVPSADSVPRRLVIALSGFEKTGKTHLALTGRSPIVLFNLDVGEEGVVEKFKAAGKEVYIHQIPLERPTSLITSPDGASQEVWKKNWKDLNTKLEQVYALNPGTVIIDTWTEAYELARLAHFGKVDQVMPNRYGPVFAEMAAAVRQAYDAESTTTVFTHKMGINFDTKQPEVKGWSQMPYMVQVNLENKRTPSQLGYGLDDYSCTIKDCRQNPHVNGYALRDNTFSIEYLETFVLDWSP